MKQVRFATTPPMSSYLNVFVAGELDEAVGEIGIIAPVSHPFCGHCSRIRITSDGKIRTCLFSVWDHDLHAQMHRGASDAELEHYIHGVIQQKEARHHIGEPDFVPASRTMVHIGG